MTECPTCGRIDFKSKTGMRMHHKKAHGKSLRDKKKCKQCGKKFMSNSDNLCSRECYAEYRSENFKGKDHPRFKEKVILKCEICKENFKVKPSVKDKRKTCSKKCSHKYKSIHYSGENHPHYKGGGIKVKCHYCGEDKEVCKSKWKDFNKFFCDPQCLGDWKSENWKGADNHNYNRVEYECDWCSEEIIIQPYKINSNNFCSSSCESEWRSDLWKGESNPSWKGGISKEKYPLDYGSNWKRIRKDVIKRDKVCQCCGEDGTNKILDVHHITKLSKFDTPEEANSMDNLILLCRSCHRKAEFDKINVDSNNK